MRPDSIYLKRLLLLQYRKLVAATSFLSTLSLPGHRLFFVDATAGEPVVVGGEYFPIVGLLLGLLLWLLTWLFAFLVPQMVLAALIVVALVLLTGGLHLDGLMDSCDGLFGGFTRERKLEIMRDSRVGSFGVLGGGCALLLKFACLTGLHLSSLPTVLLVILPSARWGMVLAMRVFPGARAAGLGATFREAITLHTLIVAGGITLIIVLVAGRLPGLLVWIMMTLVALALGSWVTRKLGGLTGDTYGAIAEVVELAGLLLFLLLRF